MTFIVFPLALFLGTVGVAIYGGALVVAILFSIRLRFKDIGARAEEFRRAGPED
jgi:NADH:ubiquinone oxidoreductase subunit 6 (subunit J)